MEKIQNVHPGGEAVGATLRLVGPSLPYAAIITSYALIIRRLKVVWAFSSWSPEYPGFQEAGDELRRAPALHPGRPPALLALPAPDRRLETEAETRLELQAEAETGLQSGTAAAESKPETRNDAADTLLLLFF